MNKKESKKIAMSYITRNEIRRSVIIFHDKGFDPVGCSTVVMPPAGADKKLVRRLIKAVSKSVKFDFITIEDLLTGRDEEADRVAAWQAEGEAFSEVCEKAFWEADAAQAKVEREEAIRDAAHYCEGMKSNYRD